MSDDLDLRGIDQRHEPDAEFRAALRRRVLDIAAGIDPSDPTDPVDFATVDIELVSRRAGTTRRRPLIRAVVAVAAAAAVVSAIVVVISRDNDTNPADTPSTLERNPLEEPSPDEVERASDAATYLNGSGHTAVTAARNYVSLRTCDTEPVDYVGGCVGRVGWAYVTGGADDPEKHYGLLGVDGYLTVSPLDDRLFVASSSPSSSQDPLSAPEAWLIDSVTGERGALSWREQPVTLNSPEQDLVLFAAQPNPYYTNTDIVERFLPRVVDRRDWTISPLRVPDDATAALSIAQPGSDRIWIGTAPDGKLGLAYTDDGGASWTDVELPQTLNTNEELVTADEEGHYPLLVAATGDHVAVTQPWTGFDDPHDVFVYVSADAGDNWTTVPIASAALNGTEIFVLADQRLIIVLALDHYSERVLVSNSASDWSRLEDSGYEPAEHSHVDVNQQGILVNYGTGLDEAIFTTDLNDWWTIPGLPSYTAG